MQFYIRNGNGIGVTNHGRHPERRKPLLASMLSPDEHHEAIINICKALESFRRKQQPVFKNGTAQHCQENAAFQPFPLNAVSFAAAIGGVGKRFGITQVRCQGGKVLCKVNFNGGSIQVGDTPMSYGRLLEALTDAKLALVRRVNSLPPEVKVLDGVSGFVKF